MNAIADRHTRSATVQHNDLMPEGIVNTSGHNRVLKRKIRRAFEFVDDDRSGDIDREEFKEIMSLIKVKLRGIELTRIFNFMDCNEDGAIEIEDMVAFLEHSFSPRDVVRCEMQNNLSHPRRFLQYHTWHIKSRPFHFNLVPGANNIEARFRGSSDPKMRDLIAKDSRLTYINKTNVADSDFIDIMGTLNLLTCPIVLDFQDEEIIKRAKMMDTSGKFHKVTSSTDLKLSDWERELFNRPNVMITPAISKIQSEQYTHQYYNHCDHCPKEAAWYLSIHLFMEDENYSSPAQILTWLIMFLIVASTFTYVFQTLPQWEKWIGWDDIEGTVSIVFTLEFVTRIASCRNMKKYLKDTMNIIDFCAVLPYWIEHLTAGWLEPKLLRVVRVVRLLRLIRLIKSKDLQLILSIFKHTLKATFHWLNLFVLVGLTTITVLASIMFIFEAGIRTGVGFCDDLTTRTICETAGSAVYLNISKKSAAHCKSSCIEPALGGCCSFDQMSGSCIFYNSSSVLYLNNSDSDYAGLCRQKDIHLRSDGVESPFHNIVSTFWFTSVTMMMVGYGDLFAIGIPGRLISVFASLLGLMSMVLPMIVVGYHFILAMVVQRYERLPQFMEGTLDIRGKGTITKILKNVNKIFGLKLFQFKEVLAFISMGNQINTQRKLEQILSYEDGWAYLPFAYDREPGLPGISQFKLFALFTLFGRKFQQERRYRKLENKRHKSSHEDLKKRVLVRQDSPFKRRDDSSDSEDRIQKNASKVVDSNGNNATALEDYSNPRRLNEFLEENSSLDILAIGDNRKSSTLAGTLLRRLRQVKRDKSKKDPEGELSLEVLTTASDGRREDLGMLFGESPKERARSRSTIRRTLDDDRFASNSQSVADWHCWRSSSNRSKSSGKQVSL